jgi:hypothetical protein
LAISSLGTHPIDLAGGRALTRQPRPPSLSGPSLRSSPLRRRIGLEAIQAATSDSIQAVRPPMSRPRGNVPARIQLPNRHVTHADNINEFTAKNQTVDRPLFGRHRSRAALLFGSQGDATLLLGKAGRHATGTGRRRYRRSVIVSRSSFDVFRSAERRAGRWISGVRCRSKAGRSKGARDAIGVTSSVNLHSPVVKNKV